MKELCLGTAMWGWSVSKDTAFSILDYFYGEGGRHVDTANNYPLNGNKLDYRKSPLFISEWCHSRKVVDLKVTYKIGSLCNNNISEIDLTPSHIEKQILQAIDYFGDNLHCIMLHWDKRKNRILIDDTLEYLDILYDKGIELGLSGIDEPRIYKELLLNRKVLSLNIQAKHNFLYSN